MLKLKMKNREGLMVVFASVWWLVVTKTHKASDHCIGRWPNCHSPN